jgi:hypothetical protein
MAIRVPLRECLAISPKIRLKQPKNQDFLNYRTYAVAQTPLCLRQRGTSHLFCCSFFRSASERTNNKEKIEHRAAEGYDGCR